MAIHSQLPFPNSSAALEGRGSDQFQLVRSSLRSDLVLDDAESIAERVTAECNLPPVALIASFVSRAGGNGTLQCSV
jgi:hypothetical protein